MPLSRFIPACSFRIGRYLLEQPLGRCGLSDVWSARDTDSGARVAFKIVCREGATRSFVRRAFRNEVRFLIRVRHPGIVGFRDCGQLDAPVVASGIRYAERTPFVVVDYVHGTSLHDLRGVIPWREARSVLVQLLGVLAHIHSLGVVHAGVSPDNILLEKRTGRIRLCDFGVVQPSGEGRCVGPSADLYGVGALAYALATGAPPFRSDVADVEPPPMRTFEPFPEGFERWVRKLLEKRPDDRVESAARAAHELLMLPGHVDVHAAGILPLAQPKACVVMDAPLRYVPSESTQAGNTVDHVGYGTPPSASPSPA